MSDPLIWHTFADETSLQVALSDVILGVVDRAHRQDKVCRLLLSGGSTPTPLYRALAQPLSHRVGAGAHVSLEIVDDRWLEPESAGSNARMMRESLLVPHAPQPHFLDLARWDQGLAASVLAANQHHLALASPPDLILFGMGDDGHTASLFPGSRDLPALLQAEQPYGALDATGCPVAGQYLQRITLTPFGWAHCQRRLLLIRGERKRQVLQQAVASANPLVFPIVAAMQPSQFPLEVYWAP